MCVTIDRVWIGEWIYCLLIHTTRNYKHLTTFSLISTIDKSPQHPLNLFPTSCLFINRSLATASNSGDSSASLAQVLLLQPPVQNSCQLPPTTNWVPGWRPFHTSLLVFSSHADFSTNSFLHNLQYRTELSTNWVAPVVFRITPRHGLHRKHRFQQYLYCFTGVFTAPLHSNGCWLVVYFEVFT
jgi:hypothetical protein